MTLARIRPAWHQHAACRNHPQPDRFHTTSTHIQQQLIADHCTGCPVRTDCLLDALDRGDLDGIWGGTTPDQRRHLNRLANTIHDDHDLEETA